MDNFQKWFREQFGKRPGNKRSLQGHKEHVCDLSNSLNKARYDLKLVEEYEHALKMTGDGISWVDAIAKVKQLVRFESSCKKHKGRNGRK